MRVCSGTPAAVSGVIHFVLAIIMHRVPPLNGNNQR
jgi:hypothetical protein